MFLNRFLRDNRGSIAPMFALVVVPLFGFMGAAIDFGRGSAAKAEMQAALDAAALMLAKDKTALTDGTLQSKALAFFNAQFANKDAQNVQVAATYTQTGGSKLTLTGSGDYPARFMNLIGINKINFGTTSVVQWGNSRLRVALALDVTGSMSSAGKITALKTATKNLLEQLKDAAAQNGDVYVSIVPFSKDVNVGKSNYNASWVRWDLWDEVNGSCSRGRYDTKSECESRGYDWDADNHNKWNGCVTDRDQNYDTTADAPTSSSRKFPAEQYSYCPKAELLPLTYDWNKLNQTVNNLDPDGNTNQTIGLQWAFQSLKGDSPLTVPPKDNNYQYQEIVILLTDGLNTENRWSGSQSSIDNRTQKACTNIKNAGITIYAIQVNTDGDDTSTMLQQCATTMDKFFLLTSANQIVSTFDAIGTAISKLRIAS